MRIKFYIAFFFLLIECCSIHAQMPAQQNNQVGFKRSWHLSGILHSRGLGFDFTYRKFNTVDKEKVMSLSFVGMKNPKEHKTFGQLDDNAKGYVYGKLNSFYVLRGSYGQRKILHEKLRANGVEVGFTLLGGVSLGVTKPEYLEVLKNIGGLEYDIVVEKYDPEVHNIYNIYGRGPGGRGISEMKFHPGIHLESGIDFEYSGERDLIRAIEVGAAMDFFPLNVKDGIPIMYGIDNAFIYPTIYISLHFGRKYI